MYGGHLILPAVSRYITQFKKRLGINKEIAAKNCVKL